MTIKEPVTDSVLIVWMILAFGLDAFLTGGAAYLVFWRGFSGWWFLLAILCGMSPTLYKVLAKRYGVPGD